MQQTAKLLHRQNESHLLLKFDISKAFDSVSWPFLLEVLSHLGFCPIWYNLLCFLLSTVTTWILLNGEPGDEIMHRRGLRQGDPLSPMLFIIVMYVLNSLISKANEVGLLQPLPARALGHRVSLYADDVILFLRPVEAEIHLIRDILVRFGETSGLKTNLQKWSAVPIRCQEDDLEVVHGSLPCVVADFPCNYLGLTLLVKKLTRADLLPLIDKLADKMLGWKAALMTRAGRSILVRVVLTAMPIYHLIAMDPNGQYVQSISADVFFFRRAEKKSMSATVWLHGKKFAGPLNLAAWVYTIWSCWVGHCVCVGSGSKRRNLTGLGQDYSGHVRHLSLLRWATVSGPYFGLISGNVFV